jgi:hypothetical protein
MRDTGQRNAKARRKLSPGAATPSALTRGKSDGGRALSTAAALMSEAAASLVDRGAGDDELTAFFDAAGAMLGVPPAAVRALLHDHGVPPPAAAERFRAVRDTHARAAASVRRGTIKAETDPARLRAWAAQLMAAGRARSKREAFDVIGTELSLEPTYLARRARKRTPSR